MRRLKILVWHVHGSYLYYLSQIPHDLYVPSKADRTGDYIGRWGHIPWPSNLHDVPAEKVREVDLDCVIFQRPNQYFEERYKVLSPEQQRLPRIYIEHDPPTGHPTNTRHPIDDKDTLLVHVTPFNRLMWDSGATPTRVIDHGVVVPEQARYTGELAKGLVVINHLERRGRLLGSDLYKQARREIPLDLVGMEAEKTEGGLREVLHASLAVFESRYRFFFNPIRYTSMGLAVCEAMMVGLPVIGMATTEMSTAVKNGVSGYVDTDIEKLIPRMRELLSDEREARRLGEGARRYALDRFNINRFIRDWNDALAEATGASKAKARSRPLAAAGAE
jgi:hypothetical protein